MEDILFVVSATAVIMFLIKVISVICGNSMSLPVPILHIYDVSFSNAYIFTPASGYQIYFWAKYLSIIGV